MALTDADVREILRIIDSAGTREISVQSDGFSLHVVRDRAGEAAPAAAAGGVHAAQDEAGAGAARAEAAGEPQTIASPMLGAFYRAEAPGEPPFVEVGSRVEADTIVCIIEVMKMMNSVPAGIAGRIVAICAENGQLVEFGAPLFRVEAA